MLAGIPALSFAGPCLAQDAAEPVGARILEGLRSSFDVPWHELFERKHPSEWRNLFDGVSVTPGFVFPLDRAGAVGAGDQGERTPGSPTATLTVRYAPLGNWFASTTFYRYLDGDARQSWNGDFAYGFGYEDWRPYTLSLVYSNYGNNRFSPRAGDGVTEFDRGTWTLGWKFPLPRLLADPMLIDRSQEIGCRLGYSVTPRYETQAGTEEDWKQAATLGCRYPVWGHWFLDGTVYWYVGGEQQPWDPDFTYGFGYADWRPGTVRLQYANYSGTRFPWRDGPDDTGGFLDGSVELSITWTF